MLKNYSVQNDLKKYVPELVEYLWQGQADFSQEKIAAEEFVFNKFIGIGKDVRRLRQGLELSTSEGKIDYFSRSRAVYNVTSYTNGATILILGSDDNITFETLKIITVGANGEASSLVTELKKYYKYSTTGTIVLSSVKIVESNYDSLYEYKWTEFILRNKVVEKDDQFEIKADNMEKMFNEVWDSNLFLYDEDEDSAPDSSIQNNLVSYMR